MSEAPATYDDLLAENIEIKSDIKTVITTFRDALKTFGIEPSMLAGGGDVMSKMPAIVGKLSFQFASGSFDSGAISRIEAIQPILEKYAAIID